MMGPEITINDHIIDKQSGQSGYDAHGSIDVKAGAGTPTPKGIAQGEVTATGGASGRLSGGTEWHNKSLDPTIDAKIVFKEPLPTGWVVSVDPQTVTLDVGQTQDVGLLYQAPGAGSAIFYVQTTLTTPTEVSTSVSEPQMLLVKEGGAPSFLSWNVASGVWLYKVMFQGKLVAVNDMTADVNSNVLSLAVAAQGTDTLRVMVPNDLVGRPQALSVTVDGTAIADTQKAANEFFSTLDIPVTSNAKVITITPVGTRTAATTQSILATPVRVLDTRPGATGACITSGQPLAAGTVLKVPVVSACTGIPTGVTGIIGNLTAVNAIAPGFLTAFPGGSVPPTSNVNFLASVPVPNSVTVATAADGTVSIYASAQTDVILDIAADIMPNAAPSPTRAGVVTSAAPRTTATTGLLFHSLTKPVRLFDSRPGQSACLHPNAPLIAGTPVNLNAITSCTGVPAGAQSIIGNGTVVAPGTTGPGFATFYPGGVPTPKVSNLNYVPGQTVPNAFIVGLDGGGIFNAFASTGTDLVIDITGYYDTSASGLFLHLLPSPTRLLDTRTGQTACNKPAKPISAAGTLNQVATGACTGVLSGAVAVLGNGTVVADVAGSGPGFVTFFPGGATLPLASNLNYVSGQVVPNAFTTGLGADGSFNSYALTSIDLVVDLSGYYAAT